jgi:hypothetical protein
LCVSAFILTLKCAFFSKCHEYPKIPRFHKCALWAIWAIYFQTLWNHDFSVGQNTGIISFKIIYNVVFDDFAFVTCFLKNVVDFEKKVFVNCFEPRKAFVGNCDVMLRIVMYFPSDKKWHGEIDWFEWSVVLNTQHVLLYLCTSFR